MNEQNIYELEKYFNELIEKSLTDLRQDLLEKVGEMLQDLSDAPQIELSDKITKAGDDDFMGQTFNSLGDFVGYAAVASVLPNINAGARLPRGLAKEFGGGVVFRPALRRIGNLAGRTIASSIFDASNGKLNYGSKQLGASIFNELFSGR